MRKIFTPFLTLICFSLFLIAFSQDDLTYQVPPKAVSINATGNWMILLERPGYPSIEELAQPELKLAGEVCHEQGAGG